MTNRPLPSLIRFGEAVTCRSIDYQDFMTLELGDAEAPVTIGKIHLVLKKGVVIDEVDFIMEKGTSTTIQGKAVHTLMDEDNRIKLSTLVTSNTNEPKPVGKIVCTFHKGKTNNKLIIMVERKLQNNSTHGSVMAGFAFGADGPSLIYEHNNKVKKENEKENKKRKIMEIMDASSFEPLLKKFDHYHHDDNNTIMTNTLGEQDLSNGTSSNCENTAIASTLAQSLNTKENDDSDDASDIFLPHYPYFY